MNSVRTQFFILLIAAGLLLLLAGPSRAQSVTALARGAQPAPVMLMINGRMVDTTGVIMDDRTMVPVRGVFQRLGARVDYDSTEHIITIQLERRFVRLMLGNTLAHVMEREFLDSDVGQYIPMGVPPAVIDGAAYVPLRFVAEVLGADVAWDDDARTARINKRISHYYRGRYMLP